MNYLTSLLLLSTNTFIKPTVTFITSTIDGSVIIETSTIDSNSTTFDYEVIDQNSSFIKLSDDISSQSSDCGSDNDQDPDEDCSSGSTDGSCDSTDNDSDSDDDRVFVHGYTVTTTMTTTSTDFNYFPYGGDYYVYADIKEISLSPLEPVTNLQWRLPNSKPRRPHSYRHPFRKMHGKGGAIRYDNDLNNRIVTITSSITVFITNSGANKAKVTPIHHDDKSLPISKVARKTSQLVILPSLKTSISPHTQSIFTRGKSNILHTQSTASRSQSTTIRSQSTTIRSQATTIRSQATTIRSQSTFHHTLSTISQIESTVSHTQPSIIPTEPTIAKTTASIISRKPTMSTRIHVVPHITDSVTIYPTNGEDVDDVTFPIKHFRTMISGEYSIQPIEGSTIYLGDPPKFTIKRPVRPIRTKRKRPRVKTIPIKISTSDLKSPEFDSTPTSYTEKITESLPSRSSEEVIVSSGGYISDDPFEIDNPVESIDPDETINPDENIVPSYYSSPREVIESSTSSPKPVSSEKSILYRTLTHYTTKLYTKSSHSKTTMTESLLTDVTKIHIISKITVPVTTTKTKWIEITPHAPTAVKSTSSYKTNYLISKTKKSSLPKLKTKSSKVTTNIDKSLMLNDTSVHNSTSERLKSIVNNRVTVTADQPQQAKLDQHSFTGVVLPSKRFIFRSMSNLTECTFSTYMLLFLLMVPFLGLLCL